METARGPIRAEMLGATLMHEHIFGLSPEILWNWPDIPEGWDPELRARQAATTLDRVKAAGIDTVVDLTVIGLGRFVPAIQRVAELTGINIVVATGVYTYDTLPGYFAHRGPGTIFGGPERMVELFVRDIAEGIGRTGVKAGLLKCATDRQGVTPGVERVLRAVAQAHRETGAPISTHTDASTLRGLDQQRIFREEGVDLSRLVIGHSGDTTNIGYLEELIANGSYIGMDRFGIDNILPFEERVRTVATMCARGHADRMVLSHDAYCFSDRIDTDVQRQMFPNYHMLHISRDVLPALKARGVTDEDLHAMLVENPRRILTGSAPY